MLDLKQLRDYGEWIGHTPWTVRQSVISVGGWLNVFPPGTMPRWASRIRQYFNFAPLTLKLLGADESRPHLERVGRALGAIFAASNRARDARKKLQDRGMGIVHAPGSSTRPGTPLVKPDPNTEIDTIGDEIGTMMALSGEVYEDALGKSIWFQMTPGGGIYHFKEDIKSPTVRALGATHAGQEFAPVFKLVSPDGTGGSREICILNPFDVPYTIKTKIDGDFTYMKGHKTIGAVNQVVNVEQRFEKDSVAQGSYNYAETTEKGLPLHQRLDVATDPMKPGYYVEPPDLFKYSELGWRRFPPNDKDGKPLAKQTERAP